MNGDDGVIAYFSMEVGIESAIPTYAGGLGVLAGDVLRAVADLGMPMVGVTLVHRRGYFRQRLDGDGRQIEEPAPWSPEQKLVRAGPAVVVELEGRPVTVAAWRHAFVGARGAEVPLFLLDTDLPENAEEDRRITDELYGGDPRTRLRQEAVLGLGGVAMLRALGVPVRTYHMNEGHSALLAVSLLETEDLEAVRRRCVFTTHTPVPAGHDQFAEGLARRVLGDDRIDRIHGAGCCLEGTVNMTYIALRASHFVNGVAMRHGEVSRGMFPGYPIDSIDNGVHAPTWSAPSFQRLFDAYIPGWRIESHKLRYALALPLREVSAAHDDAKRALIDEVARRTGRQLMPRAFTIGFARRATAYKRTDLLFADLERLRSMLSIGPVQAVFAGKAHPRDDGGKEMIRRVFAAAAALGSDLPVVYLEDYDMDLARLMCAGVDLWLNTPLAPQEASGTSGMKAALNGVPSLSVRDGWWIEGHVEGVTGWSIGEADAPPVPPDHESAAMIDKLERVILPMWFGRPSTYHQVMRNAIGLNGSFFNARRMMEQYAENAYGL